MKTHKIKRNGQRFFESGLTDEIYETFCELGDQGIEGIFENLLVGTHEECTCEKCNQAYYEHFNIQKNETNKLQVSNSKILPGASPAKGAENWILG